MSHLKLNKRTRVYVWKGECEFFLPWIGASWRPKRPNALFGGAFIWYFCIFFDNVGSYEHTHTAKPGDICPGF